MKPKPQRRSRWSWEMDAYFHPIFYNRWNYLSSLGLKLTHVSKRPLLPMLLITQASQERCKQSILPISFWVIFIGDGKIHQCYVKQHWRICVNTLRRYITDWYHNHNNIEDYTTVYIICLEIMGILTRDITKQLEGNLHLKPILW